MPHIRFHELRHSCASLLLNSGCSLKDVQEWMGHADIKMTANIYGHLDASRKQGMADKLSGSLWGKC
ncbi:MAG: tyrosine-type recombinase/integrase [Clostridia bacterium]|nr:tyrosine-type recombinase/integrase [Clostridia bacterium]